MIGLAVNRDSSTGAGGRCVNGLGWLASLGLGFQEQLFDVREFHLAGLHELEVIRTFVVCAETTRGGSNVLLGL